MVYIYLYSKYKPVNTAFHYYANPMCGSSTPAGVVLNSCCPPPFPHCFQIRVIWRSYNQDRLKEMNKHSPHTALNQHSEFWIQPIWPGICMQVYVYVDLINFGAESFVKWQSFSLSSTDGISTE